MTKIKTASNATTDHSHKKVAKMIAAEGLRARHMAFESRGFGATFTLRASPALRLQLEASGFAKELYRLFALQKDTCGFHPRPIDYLDMKEAKGLTLCLHGAAVFNISETECLASQDAARKIIHVFRTHISHAFDMDVCMKWHETLRQFYPHTINELQATIPILFQVDVIRDLLKDGLTLAHPLPILEALLRGKDVGPNIGAITDLARISMKRTTIQNCLTGDGKLLAVMMDQLTEDTFRTITDCQVENAGLATCNPAMTTALHQLRAYIQQAEGQGHLLVMLTPSDMRRAMREMIQSSGLDVPVIGISELSSTTEIQRFGVLTGAT